MIRKLFLFAAAVFCMSEIYSAPLEYKGNVTVGGTAAEESYDAKKDEMIQKYGKWYFLGDFIVSNDHITAGTKIYYRIGAAEKADDFTQRMEIKRAFLRVRPFANKVLEISGGKLYSYYLPGNFFNISEIYTGNSRWGETGVGIKSEFAGFTLGLGMPVGETSSKIETATKYDDFFGLNGAVGYDFSKLNEDVKIKLNGMAGFRRTKKKDAPFYEELYGLSLNFAPVTEGFVTKLNTTVTYSYNAKPLVANTGFQPVINYADEDLKKCHLASLNHRSNFGPVQITFEGEAGHSVDGYKIPVYGALQLLIPFTDVIAFKPRFMYYAAYDEMDSGKDRSTFEIYPRAWITYNQWTFSLGADFVNKQVTKDDWKWEWSIPFYVEYKFK